MNSSTTWNSTRMLQEIRIIIRARKPEMNSILIHYDVVKEKIRYENLKANGFEDPTPHTRAE
jgi:hypothetical protein